MEDTMTREDGGTCQKERYSQRPTRSTASWERIFWATGFQKKYGNFKDLLSFEIKDSIINIDSIDCGNEVLWKELVGYLSTDSNSPRAGEFALPTNPLLMSLPTIGNLLQDEKARVHIAFGDPYRDETGAPWESKTHVDMLLEACNVKVDGRAIMQNGKYII